MSEDDPLVSVSRDLRSIVEMSADLDDQAYHRATDRLMPGGEAMVMLGPIGSAEAATNRIDGSDRWNLGLLYGEHVGQYRDTSHAEDEDEDWEPPLQTLLFWSEQWRAEHGKASDLRPTVGSESAFLRGVLEWAWESEPHWDDFARDVRAARVRVENTLKAGVRAERTRVPCMDCDDPPRLVKVYADRAKYDHWRCPRCKRRYDRDEFHRARFQHLTSEGADRFVLVPDAIAAVKPRPEHTVRTWIQRMQVRRICDVRTRAVLVWWPDVRELNEQAKRRAARKSA